jgi:hypothetical protein
MKTYYSILFTPIRPAINEQVSVALLLISEDNMIFRYSNEKLNFLRQLIPSEATNMIKQYLEGIKKDIQGFHSEMNDNSKIIKKSTWEYINYSEKYLNYLNSYSNNLITFSKPTLINIEVNEKNFQNLYEKFISDQFKPILEQDAQRKIKIVQKQFYPRICDKVHIDIAIEKILIPEIKSPRLLLPDKINIFGKNGKYLSGQFFDFEKNTYNLKADLSSYINFIHEINDGGTNFIIGNEPDLTSEKNHRYWKEIKEYSKITYVQLDEIGVVEKYIFENDVKQLSA